MILSTILYLLVTVVNLLGVPVHDLTKQGAEPSLAQLYKVSTGSDQALIISVIGLFSIIHGVLVQILMTSRLLYGMAKEGMLPKIVSHIHTKTHTPVIATIIVFVVMTAFTLMMDIGKLADLTTFAILTLFSLVSVSLILVKWRTRGS